MLSRGKRKVKSRASTKPRAPARLERSKSRKDLNRGVAPAAPRASLLPRAASSASSAPTDASAIDDEPQLEVVHIGFGNILREEHDGVAPSSAAAPTASGRTAAPAVTPAPAAMRAPKLSASARSASPCMASGGAIAAVSTKASRRRNNARIFKPWAKRAGKEANQNANGGTSALAARRSRRAAPAASRATTTSARSIAAAPARPGDHTVSAAG